MKSVFDFNIFHSRFKKLQQKYKTLNQLKIKPLAKAQNKATC